MFKKLLLTIINILLLFNSYATSKQDSIYHDLYQFLISEGDMPKDMNWILECDSCKQYLDIFDILKDKFPYKPDFVNIPFGIYKFQYNGCIDCGYYVLIKNDDSYVVFYQNRVTLIIKELIKIRKEKPDLIDDDIFEAYIKAIVDDERGIYGGRFLIYQTIGHLKYFP